VFYTAKRRVSQKKIAAEKARAKNPNRHLYGNMTTKKNKDITPAKRKPVKARKARAKKTGRPVRTDNPQKITLHLALEIKRKAYDIATERRCSISRLVEDLLQGCKA
jgi:hypothetical protein